MNCRDGSQGKVVMEGDEWRRDRDAVDSGAGIEAIKASSHLLDSFHAYIPGRSCSKDDHWTNKNSNRQSIEMVRACLGVGVIDRTIAADVMQLGAGGVRIELGPASGSFCEVAHE